jgi:diaminohydroxyphosphoribosylaminopyrimidine deaminase / 5-amino-6-(5-phosphoribosylamino)uracil reductase
VQRRAKIGFTDEEWMQEALALAKRSQGIASPNPRVGCVLVKDGTMVGKGFHVYDWLDHAEVCALNEAGRDARGATAYVTLEPCCVAGRTGPCTRALIEAGVLKVVVATEDPNPAVHGKGLEQLRKAGIDVDTGVLEQDARHLNDGFARHIRTGLPFVNLKVAASLDGRIAPAPGTAPRGAPVYLTGEESRAEVHRMRHGVDAVMTGINTVLQDDPLLTDRSGLKRRRPLLRVVLDSGLRLPMDAKLVRSAQQDVLVFCAVAPTERQRGLEAMGVRVERVDADEAPSAAQRWSDPARRGGVSLQQVFRKLGDLNVLNVMMEAGAQLNSSALSGGHVDKVTLFYAPVFLGSAGVPLLQEAIVTPPMTSQPLVERFGSDVRVENYLRDPWV